MLENRVRDGGDTGVSKSRDGGNPPGEAVARKKRRKRRPKRHPNGGNPSRVSVEATSGANAPPDRHPGIIPGAGPAEGARAAAVRPVAEGDLPATSGDVRKSRRRKRRGGGAQAAAGGGNGSFEPSPATIHEGPGTASGVRRRKRRRGKSANPEGDALRYLRAPVRPVPAATYDAARLNLQNGNGTAVTPDISGPPPVARVIDGAPAMQHKASRRPVFAALDLGTNNCRLLIAAPDGPARFRVVDAYSRIVRLGEGLASTGRLQPDAMQRAIEALSICAVKLAAHAVAGKRLIATEACRAAENGQEFLDAVRARTGLELEIVDRETEARLAAEGCGSLMDPEAQGAVLFDIGGGSTELILVRRGKGNGQRISGQIEGWTSLPLGVVNLSERHGGRDVSSHSFEGMVSEVRDHLERFEARRRLDDIWHAGQTHLLGTSGTVTTIAGVHLELPRYDRRKVDGIWLSDTQIEKVVGDLMAMDYEKRARNPCIGRERADLVLAGCAILQAIRLTWPSPRLRVADRGLREGILNDLMHDAGVWRADRRGWRGRRRRSGGTQ